MHFASNPVRVLALSALLLGSGCAQLAAPVANVNFLSPPEESQIADQFAAEVAKEQPLVSDREINDVVRRIGHRLEAALPQRDFDYRFHVVAEESVNAFNIGGGYVYVHVGLLQAAQTEGQLASVLAHEIGHQVRRHVAKAISRDQLFQTVAAVAVGQSGSQLLQLAAGLGLTTGQLYFGREAERESDAVMVDLMIRAGYDPREALGMFDQLLRLDDSRPGAVGMMFRSHPPTGERLDNVRAQIAARSLPRDLQRDSRDYQNLKRKLPPAGSGSGGSR